MSKAHRQGRIGKGVANLFSGLLRNARDGSTYYIACRSKKGVKTRILINSSSVQNKARAVTFPYEVLEGLILKDFKKTPPNGKVKALLDMLDSEKDKQGVRLRLRDELRKTLDTVYLLVVPRGRIRLARVQLCFADKECRHYLMLYKPAPSGPRCATATIPGRFNRAWSYLLGQVPDLRKREVIAYVEHVLQEMDVNELLRDLLELSNYIQTKH